MVQDGPNAYDNPFSYETGRLMILGYFMMKVMTSANTA